MLPLVCIAVVTDVVWMIFSPLCYTFSGEEIVIRYLLGREEFKLQDLAQVTVEGNQSVDMEGYHDGRYYELASKLRAREKKCFTKRGVCQ